MHFAKLITIAAAVALMAPACSGPEPAPEPAREESAAEKAAAELDRRRNDESAQLEKRVADVERRWTEMQTKVAEKKVAPTSGLRSEVQEDIKNVREAVATEDDESRKLVGPPRTRYGTHG